MSTQGNGTTGSEFGIILLGNTGVGKSFLGNVLLGRDVFQHECNPSSVTHATEFQTFTLEGNSFAVFNIPGLIENDQAAIERNKQEIYKAFQQRPNSIVAFVFTGGSGGRVQNEDLVAFNAIHAVYNFQVESLLLIVNDLPVKRAPTYEAETQTRLEHLMNIPNMKVCFLDRINAENADERNKLCLTMIDFILGQLEPKLHRKNGDIRLQADEIDTLKTNAKEQQAKFDRQILELQQVIAEKDHQYKADKVRWEEEFKVLQEEYHKKTMEWERRITQLTNTPSPAVMQYAQKKRKHWWKKVF